MKMAICSNAAQLRLNDLIAKVAHVRIKDTLRVMVALRVVAEQYDLSVEEVLDLPYSAQKPTANQASECDRAYIGMYENHRLNKLLFKLEQFV